MIHITRAIGATSFSSSTNAGQQDNHFFTYYRLIRLECNVLVANNQLQFDEICRYIDHSDFIMMD
ncbi:hypothetical protein MHB85_30485 [Paenibacillus sp. FSL K6-4396]